MLIAAARDPDCGDTMMFELLADMPDILVCELIVKAAAENPKRGKQVMMMLLSRRYCNSITEEALMAVVENEQWGMAWVEALLESKPSKKVIAIILRAAAVVGGRRRGISMIRRIVDSYLGPRSGALWLVRWAVQGLGVVLELSDLDFVAIVESSGGVATEPLERGRYYLCSRCDY